MAYSSGGLSFATIKSANFGRCVLLGDSRTAQNGNASATNKAIQGYFSWAEALSKGRYRLIYNGGVSGDRSDQVMARLNTALSYDAGTVIIWCGVNDISQSYPSSGTSAITAAQNIIAMANSCLSVGRQVVIMTETPVTSWNSAARGQYLQLNTRIVEYANNTAGVYLCDAASVIVDPSSTTCQPVSGVYTDATHINHVGAYKIGTLLHNILSTITPNSPQVIGVGASDVFATNPYGGLILNGEFTTTSGGTAGTGASGTVPGSWTVARTAGSGTVVVSSAASPDAIGNDMVLTFTPGGSTDEFRAHQDVTLGNVVAGATYVGEVEVTVTQVAAVLRGVQFYIQTNSTPSGSVTNYVMNDDGVTGAGTTDTYTLRLQTLPLTVSATETINWLTFAVRPNFSASGSAGDCVIKIRHARMRRVIG